MKKRKSNKNLITGLAAAAAVLVTVFTIATPTGQAAIKRIIDYFAPEKTVIEDMEGQKEETDVKLEVSKLGYVIYFDKDRYEMTELQGKDRISPIGFSSSGLPEVYMDIEQVTDKSKEDLMDGIYESLKSKYITGNSEFEKVEIIGSVNDPLNAILIIARGDVKNEDGIIGFGPVEHIYLVDNTNEGTFIITQKFFYEAEEGHGLRFKNMLKEFEIIKIEE